MPCVSPVQVSFHNTGDRGRVFALDYRRPKPFGHWTDAPEGRVGWGDYPHKVIGDGAGGDEFQFNLEVFAWIYHWCSVADNTTGCFAPMMTKTLLCLFFIILCWRRHLYCFWLLLQSPDRIGHRFENVWCLCVCFFILNRYCYSEVHPVHPKSEKLIPPGKTHAPWSQATTGT